MRLLRRMLARIPGTDPYAPGNNPYDYDPNMGQGGGYPGHRAPPADLTDAAQHAGLGPLDGDTEVNHDTLNHPWGKVVKLHGDGKSITLVQTEAHPRPFPWAIQARFSLDGKTFTPTVPGTWGGDVIFKFIKSFDVKTGPAVETFDLIAGDALPICALISRKLTVSVKIVGESVLDLWVQFVVCPTTQIDCAELVPPTPTPTLPSPYGITTPNLITRFPAVTAIDYSIPAEATRASFTIVNQSAVDLFVTMGTPAQIDPGDELATIVLPANAIAGYEVPGRYVGIVSFKFAADDGDGYALVTRGFY
jgi:hypothetical protein